MITLKLDETQVANVKACILRTTKQPDVDEAGMMMLMGLVQEINRQVEEQSKPDEE